jgi:phosphatidylserine/phosphatidylglycerophosphate/cardiolipin synthase-like enzyme
MRVRARVISRSALLCLLMLGIFVSPMAQPSASAMPQAESQVYLPLISAPPPARLLIAAAHIDSALSGEPDEAVLLWNMDGWAQPLAGWHLSTGSRTAQFPITSTLTIPPDGRIWCAANAAAFRLSFGESAACEWAGDSEATAVDLTTKLTLANGGGRVQILDPRGQVVDTLLYGEEDQPATGWDGLPAQLYKRGDMPSVGQVWQRKVDPLTERPIDTNQATDWAGELTDPLWGRRVRLPGWRGWSSADLGRPLAGAAEASVTVLVGPEGLYQPMLALLQNATTSIDLAIYTFEHPELALALADAARRGVRVRVLIEGSPAGGISKLEKWCLAQIHAAGGDVRFLAVVDNAPAGYRPRYRFTHAKYLLIDDRLAVNGTENFSYDAFPIEQAAPVGGRRGYYLVTDAQPVVEGLRQIFATDWAPDRFLDIRPFDPAHEKYGAPPVDFVLPEHPHYAVAESPFREAQTFTGVARFLVISAPENALRPDDGLLALIERAGPGDELLVQQLYEHKNWGVSTSNPIADPNPRLQALIEAARRGARVRLLLDQFFDEDATTRTNRATLAYVNTLAANEGLDLQARLGNPTAGGIHAKLLLMRVGGETWSAVGSLNGGETSHKLNREIVVMTDLAGVYERLAQVFAWDWDRSE